MQILFVVRQLDYEPLGLLYLASVLRDAGHEVRLCVASLADPVAVARDVQPGLVGYSVYTGSQTYYRDLNLRLKAAVDTFSVFGGPHPTYWPEFVEEPGVDAICRGEAEESLLELVDTLEAGRPPTGIANFWFQHPGGIERNPVRPLVEELDGLPFPDRELVFEQDSFLRQSGIKHFITSRGCPYNCTYCFNHALAALYGGQCRRLRQLSVDRVIEEVTGVRQKAPLQFVVFLDDLFILHEDWLEELAAKFPHQVGLPFFCNVRANLVSESRARLLQQAGCVSVGMGLETGDPRLRNELLQRRLSDEQIIHASQLLRHHGLQVLTTNMLGLPGGTLQDDWKTLTLNQACRPAYANAFLYQPYPRTVLGDYAREGGFVEGSLEDIDEAAWDRSVLRFSSSREKRQIENLNKLFAIAVEWPWLAGLVRRLIKLPPNPLFRLAFKLWKGYAIKARIHPYQPSLREYLVTVWRFLHFT